MPEKMKALTEAEQLERWGISLDKLANDAKEKAKQEEWAREDAERLAKEEAKRKETNASLSKSFVNSMISQYGKEINDICFRLEQEIIKDRDFYKMDEFEDYLNVAHNVVMAIIKERYSDTRLRQSACGIR